MARLGKKTAIAADKTFYIIASFCLLLSVCGLRLAIAQEPLDVESYRDTIALPGLSYEMLVGADTLMWPDTAQVWLRFFAELEALRAGKDTVVTIVQLGDSHIQAGSLSGQVMRAFHHAFGNEDGSLRLN